MGTVLMMALSFVLCWALIVFYDWCATRDASRIINSRLRKLVEALTDALGFETLKEAGVGLHERLLRPLEIKPASNAFEVVGVTWLSGLELARKYVVAPIARHWFRPVLFIFLSLKYDPMTCLILMRPAYKYGMGIKEWKIFLASLVISCTSWALLVWGAMEGIKKFSPALWHIVEPTIKFLT